MNLYQLKSSLNGVDRMEQFLRDNFVSLDWPGIGDLGGVHHADRERLGANFVLALRDQNDHRNQVSLDHNGMWMDEINTFAFEMQDGDYVLTVQDAIVYLGDLGDYYYVDTSESRRDGTCHRRGVTWLAGIPRDELNDEVQELLDQPEAVSKFRYAYSVAQLGRFILNPNSASATEAVSNTAMVDSQTIEDALSILKQAMRSEDTERRERAAIAILQYARGNH